MSMSKRPENKCLYEFGAFRLDPAERVLTRCGERIPLAPKAFETLVLLVEQHGHVVTKEDLTNRLWPDTVVEENNLNQQISQLRRALGEGEDGCRYIETLSKLGYRFVSEVREFSQVAETTRSSNNGGRAAVAGGDGWDDHPVSQAGQLNVTPQRMKDTGWIPSEPLKGNPQPRARVAALVAFTLLTLLAVLASLYFVRVRSQGKPIRALAVLPFQNGSNDPNAEYLSDGISETLIGNLSQLSGLRVMARDTVFSYEGRQVDPRAVGRDLKVDAVVTGRVIERADTFIVEVDLVEVADGREIWGERYNRKLADVLVVQEEIANEMSQKLRLHLTDEAKIRLAKHSTENPEAYRLYLKGRYFASKATQEDMAKGIGYLNEAIALDPTYALAYDGIAYYYLWSNDLFLAPRSAMPKAKEAAKRALTLDDGLPQAHTEMGLVLFQYEWDWPGAEREFKRAIELDPNYAPAHEWYGYLLVSAGRIEDGIQESRRAAELDPLSLESNWVFGWMLYFGRRYDLAAEQLRKTIDLDPNYFLAHLVLGMSYSQKGEMKLALAELERATSLGECNQSLGELARALAISGKRQDARKIADRLIAEWRRSHVGAYDIAIIQAGLGNQDQALAWLEQAHEDRAFFMVDLKNEPELDPLRSDPRFKQLLRRMNFPA